MKLRTPFLLSLFLHPGCLAICAQPSGTAQIEWNLRKLNTVGNVLMIAAHPDDENTAVLAYFAEGRNLRTAYLSLTRGEGGQNLIGAEQGDYLGLLRTQELLAARRIDGAEQFFTRAIDFGYSKTAEETLAKWGRDKVLSDVVWIIRRYRPDVIILRFSGTPRDGHGQHQSSAILGKEAFFAAADPKRFPEQFQYGVQPWQARRLLFNMFSFNRRQEEENAKVPTKLEVDAGKFNPFLGLSYGEIAALSRSEHRSQGMGTAARRGSLPNFFTVIAGEPASKDLMDGIDTTWNRLPGGAQVGPILEEAIRTFQPAHPEKTVPLLLKARPLIAAIHDPHATRKLRDLDETIALCAGLWVDASAGNYETTPGSTARINLNLVSRLPIPVSFLGAELTGMPDSPKITSAAIPLTYNQPLEQRLTWQVPSDAPYTEPYWLAKPKSGALYTVTDQRLIGRPENAPVLTADVHFTINGAEITVKRPVMHRYSDHVRGELTRPFLIVPPVVIDLSEDSYLFPNPSPRTVQVSVKANEPKASGSVRLEAPPGWTITPASLPFSLQEKDQQTMLTFTIKPHSENSKATLRAIAEFQGRQISQSERDINYSHIPPQSNFPPATARLVRADIKVLAKNIGYIMGAGDEVPDALRQIGLNVTLLSDDDLASADLSRYDAIVAGVRVFNTRPAIRANFQRLLDYTRNGGTFIVQYNVLDDFRGRSETTAHIGPYPIQLSHDRVTVEEAPVLFANPNDPLLQSPNKITEKDFDGWVQERGLYFASKFDTQYHSLFSSHDPGEDWLPGGMIYTKYGKGIYMYTGYSWFRQLPAGVPGAFRIFANLLSAGK
ncbi:MAG: PIG-L family deacetylase [Bryobacterales bacterium]|nr:PIG-L family deacetylase [Bryobacterales bacterium]